MAANKSTTKRSKGKATARANATQRAARQGVGEAARRTPPGNKLPSQSRFRGETPLTGEDRPADRAGGKQQGRGRSRPGAGR
jgi:hypothetical protein